MKIPYFTLNYNYHFFPYILGFQIASTFSENRWISFSVALAAYGLLAFLKKKILEKYEFMDASRVASSIYFLMAFCSFIYMKFIHWESMCMIFCSVNIVGLHFFLKRKTEELLLIN